MTLSSRRVSAGKPGWSTSRIQGGRLIINMSSYHCRDPHVKDKTVSRPSYLQHGNPYTWERRSLYWDGAQVPDLQISHSNLTRMIGYQDNHSQQWPPVDMSYSALYDLPVSLLPQGPIGPAACQWSGVEVNASWWLGKVPQQGTSWPSLPDTLGHITGRPGGRRSQIHRVAMLPQPARSSLV